MLSIGSHLKPDLSQNRGTLFHVKRQTTQQTNQGNETMYAFMRTDAGYLLKAYEQGDDWQIVIIKPDGQKLCERWVTIWRDENHYLGAKSDSLKHAFSRACDEAKADFDSRSIQVCA